MKRLLAFLIFAGMVSLIPSWASSGPQAGGSAVVVPTGSVIAIRSNETIDSRTAREEQTFPAEVQQDVLGSSGEVLIPKGSEASLILRKVSAGGTTSSPELTLDLNSVTVNGQRYMVSTADMERGNDRGIGKNKRTGEYIGGGAAVGTLLGAIAGGGKGALIGAIAGAAAGGTVQVLTKGKEVRVPAETVLKFKLDQPLHLEPARSY